MGLIACGGSPSPGTDEPAGEALAAEDEAPTDEAPLAAGLPDGYVELRAAGILLVDGGHTLGLVDDDEGVMVPISIGGTEALSISLRLESESFTRPLTHDLLDEVMARLGGELLHVQIDRMEQGVFHASVHILHAGEVTSLDARSSDAVALAVGSDAPIYVARGVVESSGLTRDELDGATPPAPGQEPEDHEDETIDEADPPEENGDEARDDDTIEARAVPPFDEPSASTRSSLRRAG